MKWIMGIFLIFSWPSLKAEVFKNKVLAFWDSTEFSREDYTLSPTHQYIELIFNHYGLHLEYVDINKVDINKLSKKKNLLKYHGIISWFEDDDFKGNAKDYVKLLIKANRLNLKVLLMGELGFLENKKSQKEGLLLAKQLLDQLKLKYVDQYIDNPLLLTIAKMKSPFLVEFERPLSKEVGKIRGIISKSKKNKTWLSIQVKEEARPFQAIVLGDWGGLVQNSYGVFRHPITFRAEWRVNPFELVKKSFSLEERPFPDYTTLCGRRILFIHIDGDGFINISNVDRTSLSGKVILDEIIDEYSLPSSVSIVASEIHPDYEGHPRAVQVAKKIFSLDNVELASHTWTHPLSWELNPSEEERKTYLDDKKKRKKHKGPIVAYPFKGYGLEYEKEIKESIDYINSELAPKDKKAKMIFWTGSCHPPIEALEVMGENNYLNINGGDSRFDNVYNSYSNLSSLYRKVGPYIQTYTANSNENLYTNLWTGPFSGFEKVITTFKKTNSPIRIKPLNVYYHFYSGEKLSSVKALRNVYDYVSKEKTNPIYTSKYIQMIQKSSDVKIERVKKNFYKIKSDSLKTLRWEKSNLYPDYKKSKNVIGHKLINNQMYIHLGPLRNTSLVLTKRKPTLGYIDSCNGQISKFEKRKKSWTIEGRFEVNPEVVFINKGKMTELEKGDSGQQSWKVEEE
jgi:polysaccharide biosynthesis protein PelA